MQIENFGKVGDVSTYALRGVDEYSGTRYEARVVLQHTTDTARPARVVECAVAGIECDARYLLALEAEAARVALKHAKLASVPMPFDAIRLMGPGDSFVYGGGAGAVSVLKRIS